jgi:hypothetical protein
MRIVTCFDGVDVDSWVNEFCSFNNKSHGFATDLPLIKLFALECVRANKFNLAPVSPTQTRVFKLSGLDYSLGSGMGRIGVYLVCKGDDMITYDLHCEEEGMECLAN